jgi:Ca-activated chloride channel family protein
MPLLSALSSVFSSARDLIYTPPINSSGAEVVTTDGRSLPLLGAKLIATAKGGIARVVLEQTFANRHDEILHVTYRMPLPADGAVSAYAFEIDGRVIRGKVDRKHEARATFERAVASGKTAALLEQNRSDIFTQEIGNLPANKTLIARITVDQRLAWLPEGEWELRFPTVIGPRYVGASDTAADSHDTVVAVAAGPITARVQVAVSIGDRLLDGRRPSSPSHAIKRDSNGDLELATEAALDRDIVVRWPVATREVGLALDVARPAGDDHAYGLLTIVPPASAAKAVALPRDLIVLFDTSGSMSGAPLDKAKHTIAMLIESLGELDRLEVIEFSSDTHRWQTDPVAATEANKRDAIRWVRSRQANGGTEMASALRESLHALRIGAQRQVVLVTDGYIGGEQQVIQTLHDNLPKSCRLHVLGIGSAVNRSLATALARAGRGAEVLVGPDEDIERGTKRLVDRMRAPVLTNVEISGTALVKCAPEAMPDVFEGAPVVAGVALSPEGGELVVRGELAHGEARQGHPYRVATEAWIQRITVPPKRQGEGNQAIPALYAREHVADLEMRWTIGDTKAIDREIETTGVKFQIATRLTSWVAVDETSHVEGPGRHEVQPQELPYGTSMGSFGLRAAGGPQQQIQAMTYNAPIGGVSSYAEEEASFGADFDAEEITGSTMPSYDRASAEAPSMLSVRSSMPAPAAPAQPQLERMSKRVAPTFRQELEPPTGQFAAITASPARAKRRLPLVLALLFLLAVISFLVWWLVL